MIWILPCKNGTLVKTTDFIANFVYENGIPLHMGSSEGRIVYKSNGSTWFTETQVKDHLGSVRAVCSLNSTTRSRITRQVDAYYPFGMNIKELSQYSDAYLANEYMYNGKMYQDEMGLGWLDYGARMYDAVLGRWHTQDAFAEKYLDFTPYQYGANNPLSNIDINGDSTWVTTTDNTITIHTSIEFKGNAIYKKNGELKKSAQSKIDGIKNDIALRWDGVEVDGKKVNVDLITTTSATGGTEKSYDQIELKKGAGQSEITITDQNGNVVPQNEGVNFMSDLANGKAQDYNVKGVFYSNTPSGTYSHDYGHMAGYFREEYKQNSKGPIPNNIGMRTPISDFYKNSIMFSPIGKTKALPMHIRVIMQVNKTLTQ